MSKQMSSKKPVAAEPPMSKQVSSKKPVAVETPMSKQKPVAVEPPMSKQMSSKKSVVVEPPQPYNFNDWDDFLRRAVIYHNKVHPNKQLVSDRIKTLRGLMDERVIRYLGTYMVMHPRYHTAGGWEYWTQCVRKLLCSRDSTITHPVTLNGWVLEYKRNETTSWRFWLGLDKLVVDGDITSAEQRQHFWDAHTREAQDRLIELCPYFNPNNEIWARHEPGATEQAEQRLAELIEVIKIDDKILEIDPGCNHWLLVGTTTLAIVISALFFFSWKGFKKHWPVLATISLLLGLLCSFILIAALFMASELKKLRSKRLEMEPEALC